jgi:hypothetical protein
MPAGFGCSPVRAFSDSIAFVLHSTALISLS